ncbi:MAG: hypothetical protein EZS28_008952 [Streblomastix strix]|uniref:Uncharacterized protein n=1 Tax=Streblomastix strix TaxID=222440 RepID=A0A5J4WLT1_9EUKA|nr:MAG: hypothetical protein EZS28_008952 [Streblomastix strix]
MENVDAGIQGYKGKVRQQRHYGGYDPNDLIETDVDNNQNINACFDQPTLDVGSKRQPSAPDPSLYESDDERMELFGGQNR